jgi:hypothetical protein
MNATPRGTARLLIRTIFGARRNLASNHFDGTIPSELGNLKELASLLVMAAVSAQRGAHAYLVVRAGAWTITCCLAPYPML